MGLFLIGAILLLVWLWFAVQEPDCEALRHRPAREYLAPSQPPPSMGEEPRIIIIERRLSAREFERIRKTWQVYRKEWDAIEVVGESRDK